MSRRPRKTPSRPGPSPGPRAFSPRGLALAAALLAILAGGAFWWRSRSGVRRESGLSVLLITVDTLRADALGCYGHPGAGTPWMDRLAADGVRFEDAHAHSVVTLPSHANILSGRYPPDHGVRDNAGFRAPAGLETLATRLRARGYATGAFVSAFPLDSRFGLARGFDVYDDAFVEGEARPAFLEQERRGADTVALARRWLDAQHAKPTFCWVHLYEPHFPYDPPPPWAERHRGNAYQGEVAAADAALGPLLEPLLAAGKQGRTLVVLTADHGESLGEHGEETHGVFAYEATLRVPLLLYSPRLLRPRVVGAPARHVDLLPTILDALALPAPEGLPGRSLLATATGAQPGPPSPSYFEALSASLNRGWAPLHGLLVGRTKLVDLPIPELYDLALDPSETKNLAAARPGRLQEMRSLLAPMRLRDPGPERRRESAETLERLRSLGYAAPASAAAGRQYTEDDDPKRLIALDAKLQEVSSLFLAGDREGALVRCRELVRLRPQMPLSLLYLAQLERERGDLAAAVEALRAAVALNPEDTTAAVLLGACLTQAGRAREAALLLEPYASRDEPEVEVMLTRSLALARSDRPGEALATLAKARELDPSNAMVLVGVGTVELIGGNPVGARAAFEAAVALNPGVARAWSSLGVVAAEEGHPDEAVGHWRKALALDPGESAKLLAFGSLLWQHGRRSEARRYLELFVATAPPAAHARDIDRVRGWLAGAAPPRG